MASQFAGVVQWFNVEGVAFSLSFDQSMGDFEEAFAHSRTAFGPGASADSVKGRVAAAIIRTKDANRATGTRLYLLRKSARTNRSLVHQCFVARCLGNDRYQIKMDDRFTGVRLGECGVELVGSLTAYISSPAVNRVSGMMTRSRWRSIYP